MKSFKCILFVCSLLTLCSGCLKMSGLEFPFKNSEDVAGIRAFGIPNWSGTEPHNGIDIVLKENIPQTTILAPVTGVVTSITAKPNPFSHPPGKIIVGVTILVQPMKQVEFAFEPDSADPGVIETQKQAIVVHKGQRVKVGDVIGELINGGTDAAHIHLSVKDTGKDLCAYNYSSPESMAIYDQIIKSGNYNNVPTGKACY